MDTLLARTALEVEISELDVNEVGSGVEFHGAAKGLFRFGVIGLLAKCVIDALPVKGGCGLSGQIKGALEDEKIAEALCGLGLAQRGTIPIPPSKKVMWTDEDSSRPFRESFERPIMNLVATKTVDASSVHFFFRKIIETVRSQAGRL